MAFGFPNEAQKSKVKGWQWSLTMFIPESDRQCLCKVKGRQCSCGNVPLMRGNVPLMRGNVPAVRRFYRYEANGSTRSEFSCFIPLCKKV